MDLQWTPNEGCSCIVTSAKLHYDDRAGRSEAVHTNQIGFVPDANKTAYVSLWMGDGGPLALDDLVGQPFRIEEEKTGRVAFEGQVTMRRHAGAAPETGRKDSPAQKMSWAGGDVAQCEFSALQTPGRYVVSVAGVGCSFPFQIGADVYRAPTLAVLRALYLQRDHTALDAKYTDFPRALSHGEGQTQYLQTTERALDKRYGDGKQNDPIGLTGEKRTVKFGWHDAGDWDQEPTNADAVETLLLAYRANPKKWADGESHIPESGNGIPDIVDEALWGANFYRQLQNPDGSTSAGTFADWWPRDGQTSATDSMFYYVYAPDPQATLKRAAMGAKISTILASVGKKNEAADYLNSARKAWTWGTAAANLREGDEAKIRDDRCNAAAALFEATGEAGYLEAFKRDFHIKIGDPLMIWGQFDLRWAAWTYALCDQPTRDLELQNTVKQLCYNYTNVEYLDTANKRAFRKGTNWWKEFSYGLATNPDGVSLMMADKLSGDPKYRRALAQNCDITLGGNPLNMTWVTGLGARSPREIMRADDWYAPRNTDNRDKPLDPVPGILIFGPHYFAGDPAPNSGPWDVKWTQATAYPNGAQWPAAELWFETRYLAPTNEFTFNDLATAVASLGSLRPNAS